MSTAGTGGATITAVFPPPSDLQTSTTTDNDDNFGLGYVIAASLGFLFLLSAFLLAFFVCFRRKSPSSQTLPHNPPNPTLSPNPDLPRIIFVTETDEEEDDAGQNRSPKGLDPAAISSYPKFQFNGGKNRGDTVCSICLCEYREGEMLRMMPDCRHFFHLSCVDAWLRLNASCPVCRTSPMPTPLSTPLSEVVPLSQYASGQRRR